MKIEKAKKLILAIFTIGIWIQILVIAGDIQSTKTTADLIQQAHQYDSMYTLSPKTSQQDALNLYQQALNADPDDQQRLHILYRMAQLYGSSYDLSRGEKPNFLKAIELNKRIIAKYPPEEPLVYKAMSSICDHYTSLWEFEKTVKWSKKVLEYDTDRLIEQIKNTEQEKEKRSLRKALDKIKRYQVIAVDQVAYATDHISYLLTHGELRAIAQDYAGTDIAERAEELLVENMDKMPDIWEPQDPWSRPSDSKLQSSSSAPSAANPTENKSITQSARTSEATTAVESAKPVAIKKPQKDKYAPKESRASPSDYRWIYIIIAAGLAILALTVVTNIRKKLL